MTSFLLKQLKMIEERSISTTVLYFFFKNGEKKTESPVAMIATLIRQFLMKNRTEKTVKMLDEVRSQSSEEYCFYFKPLWELFHRIIREYAGMVIVIVDALDESSSRFEFLSELQKTNFPRMKFLLTSREEADISAAINSATINQRLQIQMVNLGNEMDGDIRHFIDMQISLEHPTFGKLYPYKSTIISEVCKKAGGMFKYAELVLNELCTRSNQGIPVDEVLSKIPSELYGMYRWILNNLDKNQLETRKKVLLWIAMAQGPITVREMAFILAIRDDSEEEFDLSNKPLATENDFRMICGPLID